MRFRALFALALSASNCCSANDHMTNRVPASFLSGLCNGLLEMQEIEARESIQVRATTSKSYEISALFSDEQVAALGPQEWLFELAAIESKVQAQHVDLEIEIPEDLTGCRWSALGARERASARSLLLDLSSPYLHRDPTGPAEPVLGVFARISMEGQGSRWYWIRILDSSSFSIEAIALLPVSDA